MLYSEFLQGTQAKDNLHTYSEFQRIEKIYNSDDSMGKSDAYKMYQEPDALIKTLLEELEDARHQARENAYQLVKLQREHDQLQKDFDKEKRTRISLQSTIEEAANIADRLYYKLTD